MTLGCFGDRGYGVTKCTFHPRGKGAPIADIAVIVNRVFRGTTRSKSISLQFAFAQLVEAKSGGLLRALTGSILLVSVVQSTSLLIYSHPDRSRLPPATLIRIKYK